MVREKVEIKRAGEYYYNLQSAIKSKDFINGFLNFNKLAQLYSLLGITDTTFLIMRGLPPLTTFLDISMEILHNTGPEKLEKIFKDLENNLDVAGKRELLRFMSKLKP